MESFDVGKLDESRTLSGSKEDRVRPAIQAVGHPWLATGRRIVTLAYEMARREGTVKLSEILAISRRKQRVVEPRINNLRTARGLPYYSQTVNLTVPLSGWWE